MEVKAGYKRTEVGVIPEEWSSMTCAELCVKIQDGTHFSPKIRGNDYLYLTSKNVRFGFLDISTADRIDAAQHEAIYKRCDVKHGDLLLTKDGANTGNTALNVLTEQFSLLSSVAFLRFDAKMHSAAYFLQQCLSAQGQQRMKDAMSGNAITRLTLEKIRKLRFPAAPLPEQRAIAAALSDVDALLGGLERLIVKKRNLKQAAMQQLLTGQTRLSGFSGEWELKPIGDDIDLLTGFPFPSNCYSEHGVRLLRGSNVKRGETDWSDDLVQCWPRVTPDITKYELQAGDLVIAMDGSLVGRSYARLRTTDLPALLLQRVARIRSKTIDIGFLSQFIGSDHFIKYCDSVKTVTAIPHISPSDIRNFRIPIPPTLSEQTAIATVLLDLDAELSALEARRDKTRATKQAMMQELLTGKTRLVPIGDIACLNSPAPSAARKTA